MRIRMLLAAALLIGMSSEACAATAQEIAKKAFPSTVLLVLRDRQGQPVSLGSGFLVARDTIVTNLHVVRGASSGVAKLLGQNAQIAIDGVTAVDERADLALLRVRISGPYLQLADKTAVEVGETIYAVGNPQGLEGTFSQGIISAIRPFSQGRLIQITAPISPGSSGGPVLNANGEVIGVAVATIRGGQNLNFAIPVISVSALLARQGTLQQFPTAASKAKATTEPREDKKESGERSTGGHTPSIRTAVSGHTFAWSKERVHGLCGNTPASFSIRNSLSLPVIDVQGVVIFYSGKGVAIGQQEFRTHNSTIPANATERISEGICGDVKSLTSKVEVRVLDFVTLDEQGTCMYIKRYRSLSEGEDKTVSKDIVNSLVTNQCRRLNVDSQTCERCSSARN